MLLPNPKVVAAMDAVIATAFNSIIVTEPYSKNYNRLVNGLGV